MNILVTIRRNSDGCTRDAACEYPSRDSAWEYHWGEGNYGCDCNRHLFFERAAPREDDPWDDGYPCGESAYSVLKIADADSGELLLQGDPRP